MDHKTALLAMVAGLAVTTVAPAGATAAVCGCVHHVVVRHKIVRHRVIRHVVVREEVVQRTVVVHEAAPPPEVETVTLPATFFADTGGVGPAFVDFGGGGGGIAVVQAGASASAFASASAKVSVAFNVQQHQHMQMMKMHMGMPHGGKW